MKWHLILLLFLPLFLDGQNEKWLTPYANIEFKDSMIVYNCMSKEQMFMYNMYPLKINKNLLRIVTNEQINNISGSYILESKNAISDFLSTELVSMKSTDEQEEYLRLAALMVILDQQLDPFCVKEVKFMEKESDPIIRKEAALVWQLMEYYQQK